MLKKFIAVFLGVALCGVVSNAFVAAAAEPSAAAQTQAQTQAQPSTGAELCEYDKIQEAVAAIRARWDKTPEVGIILGTGLGDLANVIDADVVIPYEEIPYFPTSTVESHKGRLILGTLEGKTVVAMQGRVHYYEGYSGPQIAFPVRVMKTLGAKTLIVSNAAGGMNPYFERGDVMAIEDHINLFGGLNPLVGPNDERIGPRFPDMSEPYSKALIEKAEKIALEQDLKLHKGVYVGLLGPNFETRAEYRFLRGIGADAVGMSTVPEVIAAKHCGMNVLGFSIITDMCLPDALNPSELDEILEKAAVGEKRLTALVRGVLKTL